MGSPTAVVALDPRVKPEGDEKSLICRGLPPVTPVVTRLVRVTHTQSTIVGEMDAPNKSGHDRWLGSAIRFPRIKTGADCAAPVAVSRFANRRSDDLHHRAVEPPEHQNDRGQERQAETGKALLGGGVVAERIENATDGPEESDDGGDHVAVE